MNTEFIAATGESAIDLPDYIFYKFDSLRPGKGFIIHEENDPQPLHSLLLKERGEALSWEYLTIGPKKWCIRISKKVDDVSTETLGELALSDHRKALVLRKYGLDYSFKGNRTLKEACDEKEISTKNVDRDLKASARQPLVYTVKYNNWDLDYLADFMVTNHHQYARKTLAGIAATFTQHSAIINQQYTRLLPLVNMFNQMNTALLSIMELEEQLLFPYIQFLVQVTKGKINADSKPSASIQDHISTIESAQQKIGEQLVNTSAFTNNYTSLPVESSLSARLLPVFNQLATDLHEHVHIENNILFRKALLLEQEYHTNLNSNNKLSPIVPAASSRTSSLL